MLSFLGAIPGGSSIDRDTFSRSLASMFGTVVWQDEPVFAVSGHVERYLNSYSKSIISETHPVRGHKNGEDGSQTRLDV